MSAGISKRLDFRGRESARIISAIAAENYNGEYPLTAANYPGLLEAFTTDGISGNNLVGELGTVTITCSTGWTQPAAGRFRPATAAALTTSGAWGAIGNKHALLMAIGTNAVGTGTRIGLATSANMMATGLAFNTIAFRVPANSSLTLGAFPGVSYPIDAVAVLLDQTPPNGLATAFGVDGAANLTVAGTTTGDISASWSAFGVGASGAILYSDVNSHYTGIYLVTMTWLPTAQFVYDALRWMVAHPKFLYPGFYKRP